MIHIPDVIVSYLSPFFFLIFCGPNLNQVALVMSVSPYLPGTNGTVAVLAPFCPFQPHSSPSS